MARRPRQRQVASQRSSHASAPSPSTCSNAHFNGRARAAQEEEQEEQEEQENGIDRRTLELLPPLMLAVGAAQAMSHRSSMTLALCYVAILCTLLCAEEEEEHGWSE